jgi:hypothetical protein
MGEMDGLSNFVTGFSFPAIPAATAHRDLVPEYALYEKSLAWNFKKDYHLFTGKILIFPVRQTKEN